MTTSWHNFDKPGAFTALYLLAESHLSIHTWPEHGYIAIDVFTCGQSDTQLVVDKVIAFFAPTQIQTNHLHRGEIKKNDKIYDTNVMDLVKLFV